MAAILSIASLVFCVQVSFTAGASPSHMDATDRFDVAVKPARNRERIGLRGSSLLHTWGQSHASSGHVTADGKPIHVKELPADGELLSLLQRDDALTHWGEFDVSIMEIPADGVVNNVQDLKSFGVPHGGVVELPVDSGISLLQSDLTLQSWGEAHGPVLQILVDGMVRNEESLQHWGGHAEALGEHESTMQMHSLPRILNNIPATNPDAAMTSLLQTDSDEVDQPAPFEDVGDPDSTASLLQTGSDVIDQVDEAAPALVDKSLSVLDLELHVGDMPGVPLPHVALGSVALLLAVLSLRACRGGVLVDGLDIRSALLQCSDRGS